MKATVKALALAGAVSCAALLSGCATPFPLGLAFTKVTMPGGLGDGDVKYSKFGESSCTSLFGWFAAGDASISEACKTAQISKAKYVSVKVVNIFGVWGSYKTVVYGD